MLLWSAKNANVPAIPIVFRHVDSVLRASAQADHVTGTLPAPGSNWGWGSDNVFPSSLVFIL